MCQTNLDLSTNSAIQQPGGLDEVVLRGKSLLQDTLVHVLDILSTKAKEEIGLVITRKAEITRERDSLAVRLRSLEEEKSTLDKTLQLTNEKLVNLNDKYEAQQLENGESRRLIERLEQDQEFKRTEISELKRKLDSVESDLDLFRRNLTACQTSLEQEERTNEKLTKDLKEANHSLKELEKSRSDLKREVRSLKVTNAELVNELAEKSSEIEKLNHTIEKKNEREQQRIEEASKEKALLIETEAEKQTVKKENVSLKHRISELEHLLKLEKNTSKKQEEEIKRLDSMKSSLESKLTSTVEEVFTYQKTVKELETKLKSVDTQLTRTLDEKEEMEEQFAKLNSVLRSCLVLGNVTLDETEVTNFDDSVQPLQNVKSYLVSCSIDSSEFLDLEFVRSALTDLLTKVETLSKERDDLTVHLEQSEQMACSVQEMNRKLKDQLDQLESDFKSLDREKQNLIRKTDELHGDILKSEEALAKCNAEKKSLICEIETLTGLNDKLDKERRKLSTELNSLRTSKSLMEKDLTELKKRYEGKVEKLEAVKESLDSRITSLIKNNNQLNEEKESLLTELKLTNNKVADLQNHNYKLYSALNDTNRALKRSSDGEKDLIKKMSSLADSVEQQDAASKDVYKQNRQLKEQIQELKSEKSSLQNTIESERHNLAQTEAMVSQLKMKVKQLEAELNLTNIKRKEAEFQQTILTNANADKEAKIKDLKGEIASLEECYKQLMLNQKTLEKSISVSSINRKNADKIAEEALRGVAIVGSGGCGDVIDMAFERGTFVDETNLTAKGLKALEEENIKLQRKVKSLQEAVSEASNVSANVNDLSVLREAQKQAESLLIEDSLQPQLVLSRDENAEPSETNEANSNKDHLSAMMMQTPKRYTRSEPDNETYGPIKGAGHNQQQRPDQLTTPLGQTRFRTSSRTIQESTRTERTQITSTPISSSSIIHRVSSFARANEK